MNRRAGLEPAHILFTEDGTPHATDYQDVYHSASGGLEQARHVFLGGNDLPSRWSSLPRFAILETGFGLGINFLATWQAWLGDPQRPDVLHYFAVEKHPPGADELRTAHARWPELTSLSNALCKAWPEPVAGFHRLHFEHDRIHLTLMFGDVRQQLSQVEGRFDAIYLDGFSPERNPEMWAAELMTDIAWLAKANATCASYTIARSVRDALSSAGFALEKRAGFGTKRDMLIGHLVPSEKSASPALLQSTARTPAESIIVIGAGIAGITIAERLARHGRHVVLLEERPSIAQGATGNKLSALLPALAIDETRLARLNRAAFFYTLNRLQTLADAGHAVHWSECGVLQMPRSDELARRQERIIADQQLPAGFVRMVDAVTAQSLSGAPLVSGGWWFARGGWVDPVSVCHALLESAGSQVELRPNVSVNRLEYKGGGWQLWGHTANTTDTELCHATTVILANSHSMLSYPQAAHLPLLCYRGQVSHLPSLPDEAPHCVVCGDGYLTPVVKGERCLGASFERSDAIDIRVADHESNLARMRNMLQGDTHQFSAETLTGRAGLRPVSPDKLPLLGALPLPKLTDSGGTRRPAAHGEWPRWPGLYVATGYGARGMVWSHLMAELLACQIVGEPLPVEADLVAAVDPARYPWRHSG